MTIRPVRLEDSARVAALSGELGYPATADVMHSRLRSLQNRTDRAVLVACADHDVVGWIDVGLAGHLQSGDYAEIGGLVVSERVRGQGIGRALVEAAEAWAAAKGLGTMLVRSQIARDKAHGFYLREGYERTKTSAVFQKKLDPPDR